MQRDGVSTVEPELVIHTDLKGKKIEVDLQQLPSSQEVERSILGAALLNNSVVDELTAVKSADFSVDAHRLIFSAILELSKSETPADIVTLGEYFEYRKQLHLVGGREYISGLTVGIVRLKNISHWIRILREHSAKRLAARSAESIALAAADASTSAEQLVSRFSEAATALGNYQQPASAFLTRVCDVEARSVDWLWEGRIARGTLTIFDGDPGRGKGLVVCDLVARITTGKDMPDGSPGAIGRVMYLTTEDAVSFVVRPRLEVAKASVEHVYTLTAGAEVKFPESCDMLERAIIEHEAVLVIVDPLSAFLGDGINSHKDADVRRALGPLHQVAESTGVSVIGVRHLNKSYGGSAMYRGGGSIAISAAARSVVTFGVDPAQETDRIMAWTKLNIATMPRSMRYQIVTEEHPTLVDKYRRPVEFPKIKWMGECDIKADELVQMPPDQECRSMADEAHHILLQAFGDRREIPAVEGEKLLRSAGISHATASRARKKLGVRSRKNSFNGKWDWYLSEPLVAGKVFADQLEKQNSPQP